MNDELEFFDECVDCYYGSPFGCLCDPYGCPDDVCPLASRFFDESSEDKEGCLDVSEKE